jgi:ATP-dependent helicase HrpB
MKLPIESVLPDLAEALRLHASAVLVAEPGAGKTTRVPLFLMDKPWLEGRRIVMLEPRRLAARAAASYMAASLGEQVGETVGYRVRADSRVGPATRIEVVTEGVLTRLLQADPALEGIGLVIFDEFHERSLHADLGLALCLQSRDILRDDLKMLVMSATLDAEPVAMLMGGAPILRSEGRGYPVATRHVNRRADEPVESAVTRTVLDALANDEGDILVFLPGAGEIRRTEARLAALDLGKHVRIFPLHGSLPREAQDRAIAPGPPGLRKVVLATSVAETSLTVEGVRIVIDSGLMRVPRYSPRTGMTRLETVPVSRASADQRRGRAGRLAPGVCYRLWSEQDDRKLAPFSTPEILEADLTSLALELAAWGVSDPAELKWLNPPPAAAFRQARELLGRLGALGADGTLTPHGKRMAEFGLHPRLSHMILRAIPHGLGGLACELAAILSERDFLRNGMSPPDADIRQRVEAIRNAGGMKAEAPEMTAPRGYGAGSSADPGFDAGRSNARKFDADFDSPSQFVTNSASPSRFAADAAACRRIAREAERLKREFRIPPNQQGDVDACGLLLAFAYPDRIAERRPAGRFLLSSGRGAAFVRAQPLSAAPYLVAAELDDQGVESTIFMAAPVDAADLERHFADNIETETLVAWNREAQAVQARKRVRLGAVTLREAPLADPDPQRMLAALIDGIAREGLRLLPWSKAACQLRQRLAFMHRLDPSWPDVSDEALVATLAEWLAPHLYGMRSRDDLQRLDLAEIFASMLPWERRRELDECAPAYITVPSGSRIAIDYSDPAAPVLAVRLQELFGLESTPRIARGKVPLTLHLLSPAHRPVQVTQDLASFWREAYFEVKKDLKGRYPKHDWPDDPIRATPTNRVRPRR